MLATENCNWKHRDCPLSYAEKSYSVIEATELNVRLVCLSREFGAVRNPPASIGAASFPASLLAISRGGREGGSVTDPGYLFFVLGLTDFTRGAACSSHAPSQFILSEEDMIDVAGVGYEPVGDFTACGRLVTPRSSPAVASLLEAACLCNNAVLGEKAGGGGGDMR